MKDPAVTSILVRYASLFSGGASLAEETLAAYTDALSDIPLPFLETALRLLSHKVKFFPSVAEIYEVARDLAKRANGRRTPTAEEAWKEVEEQAGRYGLEKEWTFTAPEIDAAVRQIGRTTIVMCEETKWLNLRQNFLKTYEKVVARKTEEHEIRAAVRPQLAAEMQAVLNQKVAQIGKDMGNDRDKRAQLPAPRRGANPPAQNGTEKRAKQVTGN